jgi:hypothetical protein
MLFVSICISFFFQLNLNSVQFSSVWMQLTWIQFNLNAIELNSVQFECNWNELNLDSIQFNKVESNSNGFLIQFNVLMLIWLNLGLKSDKFWIRFKWYDAISFNIFIQRESICIIKKISSLVVHAWQRRVLWFNSLASPYWHDNVMKNINYEIWLKSEDKFWNVIISNISKCY